VPFTLRTLSLPDLLAAFSAPAPTPGGGSAAALATALGASLLMMVAGLPKTRTDADAEREALAAAGIALERVRDGAAELIDRDSAAYDEVVAAYRLPKGDPAALAARTQAVQAALRRATEVPLEVMRRAAEGLALAREVARHGRRAAASDVGVGVGLLRAGLRGAGLNVDVNLGGIADEAFVARVRQEADALATEAGRDADEAEARLA